MSDLREEELKFSRKVKGMEIKLGSHVLAKAWHDPYIYAMGLVTGDVIVFSELTHLDSEWIHLTDALFSKKKDGTDTYPRNCLDDNDYRGFGRGVDIRLSSIVWVADNPQGH